jgi:dTMP kinase
MKKGSFICITGIDGSGKSTLAKALVSQMRDNGIKCKYVYNRQDPFLLRPFMIVGQKLFLRGKDTYEDHEDYAATKRSAIKKNPLLARVYQLLMMFDYSLQVFVKVRIPLLWRRTILCDRYVYDTVVTDLAVDFDYSEDTIMRTIRRFFRVCPRPDLTLLVDVPEEIALARKDDVPSLQYLQERRRLYLKVAETHGMTLLDGSRSQVEVLSEAKQEILRKMGTCPRNSTHCEVT